MARLPLHLLAAASALLVLSQTSSARAESPAPGPPSPTPSQIQSAGPHDDAPMLPGQIMGVLGALQAVGVVEIDKSSALVSSTGVIDTARLPVRAPVWLAPEPPKMPLFFSRVVQWKF